MVMLAGAKRSTPLGAGPYCPMLSHNRAVTSELSFGRSLFVSADHVLYATSPIVFFGLKHVRPQYWIDTPPSHRTY